jgi:hypothetical protein
MRLLERGERGFRHPVGETGAPFIEEDEPAEGREPVPQRGPARVFPPVLQVGDEPHDHDEILGPRPHHLVGDMGIAAVRVPHLGGIHVRVALLGRRKA